MALNLDFLKTTAPSRQRRSAVRHTHVRHNLPPDVMAAIRTGDRIREGLHTTCLVVAMGASAQLLILLIQQASDLVF